MLLLQLEKQVTMTDTDVVVIMGKYAVLKYKAASVMAQEGQTVMQREGKPRVAARLAQSVTSQARGPSHRRSSRRTEQVQ